MVAVPTVTAVITPVLASIVATAVLSEDQVPPATVEVKVEVPLEQIICVPLNVPAVGQFNTIFCEHVPVAEAEVYEVLEAVVVVA